MACERPPRSLRSRLPLTSTSVQVSVVEVVERRVQCGRDRDMWLGSHFERANSPPRMTASRGGGVIKKWCEASLWTPPGWCSLSHRSEHHPVLAKSGCCAIFLDRSATPPRGDARRGIRHFENSP